ncbi:hypothetical protein [Salmonirosea aquatica]|uniref:hypothetical protein n=1 Tax=Salmonirosea aquatica TaxID=2654236 RepID=UPI003571046D
MPTFARIAGDTLASTGSGLLRYDGTLEGVQHDPKTANSLAGTMSEAFAPRVMG